MITKVTWFCNCDFIEVTRNFKDDLKAYYVTTFNITTYSLVYNFLTQIHYYYLEEYMTIIPSFNSCNKDTYVKMATTSVRFWMASMRINPTFFSYLHFFV